MTKSKYIIIIAVIFFLCFQGISYGATIDSNGCCSSDKLNQEQSAVNRISQEMQEVNDTFEDMIEIPERSSLESCIKGINLVKQLGWGMPDLSDLFNLICDEINDKIDDEIKAFQQDLEFSPMPGFSFSLGGDVKRASGGIADSAVVEDVKQKSHHVTHGN